MMQVKALVNAKVKKLQNEMKALADAAAKVVEVPMPVVAAPTVE